MADNKKTVFRKPFGPANKRTAGEEGFRGISPGSLYRMLRNEARKIVEDGARDAAKETIKHEEENKEKFEELVKRSQKVLLRARAVFPFDFFPDEIVIEPTQVNLHMRSFFWTQEVMTLHIRNIVDCMLDTSPFFASITFVDVGFGTHNYQTIAYLKKSDAVKARNIIQGLITASKEDIDVTAIPVDELRSECERLGRTHAK